MRRLSALPFLALAFAAPAGAQQAGQPGAAPVAGDIVVTARSLQDTADALAACIARNCPPDEDIAATLAHAENQFVGGDYRSARRIRQGVKAEVEGLCRGDGTVSHMPK